MTPLHKAARANAESMTPVFPVSVDGKVPACANGFKAATLDLSQIDAWWGEADFNIGICPNDIGCLVVDIDPGADLSILEKLPLTYTVRTPRGGYHLYFEGGGRTSASKIAPHVDTRGVGGYVVAAPSVVNGQPYTVEKNIGYAPVPDWITKALASPDTPVKAAVDEMDLPVNVDRARTALQSYVKRGDVAIEGQGGDDRTYRLCCELLDLGLSVEMAKDLLEEIWNPHCQPPWNDDELDIKLQNAAAYQQNEPGAYGSNSSQEVFGDTVAKLYAAQSNDESPADGIDANLVKLFRGREPDEDEALPDIDFLDDEKTLPINVEGGCCVVAYGDFGCMKTTLMLADAFEAIQKGKKVVFGAGEGAHGIRKSRLPAYCLGLKMTTRDLRGKFRTCPAVPNLTSEVEVASFIEAFKDFAPDIVYLDTLATASGGVDENSDAIGKLLTSNGPVGKIRRAFNCTVVLIHHTGKDDSRGARGHSSIGGNADALWKITADKEIRTITKKVEKMRDGEDDFSVEYKVTPPSQVPVARKIGRVVSSSYGEATDLMGRIAETLKHYGATSEKKALSAYRLSRLMLAFDYPECAEEGVALTTEQEKRRKAVERQLDRAKTQQKFAHLVRKIGSSQRASYQWSLPYHDGGAE